MQASQERAVIDMAPGQQTIEVRWEGHLADADADLVVAESILGPVLEDKAAEMRVGVQTA